MPNENTIRTSLKLEGDISEMQTDEAQDSFKGNLASAMGLDSSYINIASVYEGSIVVVYDLVADENNDVSSLAQASQNAFKSGAVAASVGYPVLDVAQKDSSGAELKIVKDGELQEIPDVAVIGSSIPELVIDPASLEAAFIQAVSIVDMKDFLCDNYKISFEARNYKSNN